MSVNHKPRLIQKINCNSPEVAVTVFPVNTSPLKKFPKYLLILSDVMAVSNIYFKQSPNTLHNPHLKSPPRQCLKESRQAILSPLVSFWEQRCALLFHVNPSSPPDPPLLNFKMRTRHERQKLWVQLHDASGPVAELVSVVPAPSPTNKGDFQAASFWHAGCGVATLMAMSHETGLGRSSPMGQRHLMVISWPSNVSYIAAPAEGQQQA